MNFVPQALLLGLFLAAPCWADSLREGSTVPFFSVEDQHGRTRTLDETVRVILFSRDMDAGEIIKQTLEENGEKLLNQSGAVYIADISGMPWLIREFVAEPRMRERSYSMLLDRDGSLTEKFPHHEGKPTFMVLDKGKILRIDYLESPAQLKRHMAQHASP